jgi:predicted nucleic acid-binding protein
MTELLVPAYREADESRVNKFYSLLVTFPNLEWIAPDLEIADIAARLRAHHRMRTPDALQAATAIRAQAPALVTNDPIFSRIPAFETMLLDSLL